MLNHILEISKRASKGGRVPIKIALLKIHEDEKETNRNGIHWKEEYVTNAIDSVKMMPICASFIDEDKSVPLDHGLTGETVNEDGINEPLFENSETVGCFESAIIENITVNGNEIKALTAQGYLYNQRYPSFVKWVRENNAKGNVDTSIEIMGLDVNDNKIVYEEENPTNEFRTPMEFTFSGSCILSVQPADADAIVLEIAQKKENNKEEQTKMDENKIIEIIQKTITETNAVKADMESKIAELNSTIGAKDTEIKEANDAKVAAETNAAEKDSKIAELEAENAKLKEEISACKKREACEAFDAKLANYSEEEKKCVESEINAYKENPLEGNADEIISKICVNIVANQKKAETEARIAEQNSSKDDETIDIFSEVNSADEDDNDTNIF